VTAPAINHENFCQARPLQSLVDLARSDKGGYRGYDQPANYSGSWLLEVIPTWS
jgi:hypothetical protein